MNTSTLFFQALCLGVGATVIMDIWLLILKIFKIPTLNFSFLGRWVGWIFQGKLIHQSIAQSPQIQGEYLLGWITHYSVGIIFALSFLVIVGSDWLIHPQFYSALIFGVVTVLIPFLLCNRPWVVVLLRQNPAPFSELSKSLLNHSFLAVVYISPQNYFKFK